jgi:hypothetical protein
MSSTPSPSASPPAGYLNRTQRPAQGPAPSAGNGGSAGPPDAWLEVRDRRTGKLLCQYNPATAEILVKRGGRIYVATLPSSWSPSDPSFSDS